MRLLLVAVLVLFFGCGPVLPMCGGRITLSSLVHELIINTMTRCDFEIIPPSEANTTLLFLDYDTSIENYLIGNRSCYFLYSQRNESKCVDLTPSRIQTIPINGSFSLTFYRSQYALNMTLVVNSYQGSCIGKCESELEVNADTSMQFTLTRTTGCQDYCIVNLTTQRAFSVVCPTPFCHYILYSYALGQLMRPSIDNTYSLNGTKANLLLYVPSNNRMRLVVEGPVIVPPTTTRPSTTTAAPTTAAPTTTAPTTSNPIPTTSTNSPVTTSIAASTTGPPTQAPTTTTIVTTTSRPTTRVTTQSTVLPTTTTDYWWDQQYCGPGFFRRLGCYMQRLWEKLKAFIDSYNRKFARRS